MTCARRSYIAFSGESMGGEEQKEEQQIEDLQRGRVIDMSRLSRKQHEV